MNRIIGENGQMNNKILNNPFLHLNQVLITQQDLPEMPVKKYVLWVLTLDILPDEVYETLYCRDWQIGQIRLQKLKLGKFQKKKALHSVKKPEKQLAELPEEGPMLQCVPSLIS